MFEPSRLLITGGYINFITNNVLGLGEQKLRKAVLNDAMSISQLPQACCPGTRMDILRWMLLWIDGREVTRKAAWLVGGVASGKSAIARSIIQMCAHNAALKGAIVFLFPSKTHSTGDTWGYIIPTIACQIAAYIPKYLEALQGILHNSLRDIVSISIQEQIQLLISTPLGAILSDPSFTAPANLPRIIVIDGLNELEDNVFSDSPHSAPVESQEHVMSMLLTLAQQDWFPFKLLITSRPPSWYYCNTRPATGVVASPHLNVCLLESYDARPDIRTYFESMFKSMIEAEGPQIFSQRGQQDWNYTYGVLVDRTGGHFGHAASIDHFMHTKAVTTLPDQRLQALLNYPNSRVAHPRPEENPFREIDAELSYILKTSIQHSTSANIDAVTLLFAYCILPHSPKRGDKRLTVHDIEQFHNVRCKSILQGLLSMVRIVDGRIELLYPCIAEYLLDKNRSGEFHVDSKAQYILMTQSALRHLSCSRVDSAGNPLIKDNVYALACESLKSLIHHIHESSSLSTAFEAIDYSHIQRSRPTGLDSLCAFDTILICADSLSYNIARTIHASLEKFIAREMDMYLSSPLLASVMDFLVCSELIELSGVSDHSLLLRVILPENSQEYIDDTTSLKLRQLLLFGRRCCPQYLAFIRRSIKRILHQRSKLFGQDESYFDYAVYDAIHTRHAQVLLNMISTLRSHVQHRIQSDSNIVVYCMRCLPAVLSKAEPVDRIAALLKPENRPWEGLPAGSLPSGIVQAANEAAELYRRNTSDVP